MCVDVSVDVCRCEWICECMMCVDVCNACAHVHWYIQCRPPTSSHS